MLKIGVLSNPHSDRNRRGFADVHRALAGAPDAVHREIGPISDVRPALEDFARQEVGLVVVNGGDGTVQATLTELLGRRPFPAPPPLAVLGRGMSNMIAGDVGLKGAPAKALPRLIAKARKGDLDGIVTTRHAMRMEHTGDGSFRYGMFFGAAAIYRAIETSRRVFQPLGIRDPAAAGLTLGSILLGRLLRRQRADGVFRGDSIAVDLDGERHDNGSYFLVFVTTLDRLMLNARPFWGEGDGGLRYTSVAFPPPRLLRLTLPLLYGRRPDDLPPEYVSRNVGRVSLAMTCPFTLDGELFEPVAGVPVTLTSAEPVRFVRV